MDDVRYRLHLSLPSLFLFLYSLTARLFNPYDEPCTDVGFSLIASPQTHTVKCGVFSLPRF